jgi:hypothetical protein
MDSPSDERGGAQATQDRRLSLGLAFPSAEGDSHQIHLKGKFIPKDRPARPDSESHAGRGRAWPP